MKPEQLIATPPENTQRSKARFVFFNDRGLRAGWRLIIFAGILYAITVLVLLATKFLGGGKAKGPQGPDEPIAAGIARLVPFLVILLVSWVMSRIERRSLGEYGLPLNRSVLRNLLTGYFLWGFLPLSLLLLSMRALHVFYFGSLNVHGGSIVRWGLLWAFAVLMVGFFEEFLFRGYVLHTLADGIRFWPAAIVMSLVFGAVHLGNSGETIMGALVTGFLYGMFAATTLRLTGNLWLAVGAHAGWDWGQTFFYGVNDSGTSAVGRLLSSHVQGPNWLNGGSVGPEGSPLASLMLILMTIAFVTIYRKRREADKH